MERIDDGPLGIVIAGPAGFGNNIYVLVDSETGEAAFVDAPDEAMEAGSRIEPAEAQWKERTPPMDQREKKPVDLDEPYGTSMVFDREQAKVYMVGYTGEPSAGTSYTFGMQEYEALLRIGTRDFRVTLLDPLHSKACMAGSRCVRLSSVHPGKSASTVDIYMYQGGRASGAAKH